MKKGFLCAMFLMILCSVLPAGNLPDKPQKGVWNLKPEQIWAVSDFGGEAWGKPGAVLILGTGQAAVYDPKLDKNILLDAQGRFVKTFAPKGEGPQEVRRQSFWFNLGGRIIIPDMGRVQEYDEQGNWLESRKVSPMPPPRGFLDRDHMVMVPRTVFEIGGGKGQFSVVDLKTAQARDLFELSDLFDGGYARMGDDVVDMLVPGLTPMVEVGIGPGFMVYGLSSRYQLMIVDSKGHELRRFGLDRQRAPISHARIAEHLTSVDLPAEKAMEMAKTFEEKLVFFDDILIMGNQIWVQAARTDKAGDCIYYDIFSKKGAYLYRAELRLPNGSFLKSPFRNHAFGGDRLVAVVERDDGRLQVAAYRVSRPQS